MSDTSEAKMLEALLWAWTNLSGCSPDSNTMTEAEIADYWQSYAAVVEDAIKSHTGMAPEQYMRRTHEPIIS